MRHESGQVIGHRRLQGCYLRQRRCVGPLEGAHQVQLPRRFVGAMLPVRHAQHVRKVNLQLDDEAVVDEIDVHIAVAARRCRAAEPILYLNDLYALRAA